jgi:sec-independent protein translocase protein TatB
MFDFGFSELMLIGAVALVVLGPEKLPVVAKTAGEWIGKAQRLVQQVKSDIEREAELSELKKIQDEAKTLAEDLNNTVKSQTESIGKEVKALETDIEKSASDAQQAYTQLNADGKDSINTPRENAPTLPNASEAADTFTSALDMPDPVDDFYGWYGKAVDIEDEEDETKEGSVKSFDKRYKAGPSVEELAEQLHKLKMELGDRSPQFGGNNRRYTARARSNRVRIYR